MRRAFAMLVIFLVTGCVSSGAQAAISVDVVPAAIQLSHQGEAGHVHVVVANAGDDPLRHVRLTPLRQGARDLVVTSDRRLRPVSAGSIATFSLTVRARREPLAKTAVSVLVRYDTAPGVTGAETARFTVGPPAPLDLARVASVRLESSLSKLNSGDSAPIYLIVTNRTSTRLHVGRIVADVPSFLTVSGVPVPHKIAARAAERIKLTVKAADSVRPGKHQLAFQVPVAVGSAGRSITLTTTASTTVAVETESALLTAVGVPALFLMPGFLLVAMASLLWRSGIFRGRRDGPAFFLEPKSVEFWLVSITSSLVLLVVWSILEIDLFGQYSRDDVVVVWALSLGLGLLLYLLIAGTRWAFVRRREFNATDGPVAVLEKLGRLRTGPALPRYEIEGRTGAFYLLEPRSLPAPELWLAPAINVEMGHATADLEAEMGRYLDEEPDSGKVAEVIRRLPGDPATWDGGGPLLVAQAMLGPPRSSELIVKL